MTKFKFNPFLDEENHLDDAKMSLLYGGNTGSGNTDKPCSCGCLGTSSVADNKTANVAKGLTTPGYRACDSIFKKYTVTWKDSDTPSQPSL